MGSILTLVNTVLGLLSAFVAWGQSKKVFKENEAIIALTILRKSQEDIKRAKVIEDRLNNEFKSDPNAVHTIDEFTRNSP